MKKTLLIGYGNLDRQDDGAAWHVLVDLLKKFDKPTPNLPEEDILDLDSNPSFLFYLQLTPELAEIVAKYDRVCFIDAHTGNIPQDILVTKICPIMQISPFTHHMTPQTCLSLSKTLFNGSSEAILTSLRGFEFDFSRVLSHQTQSLVSKAADVIWEWAAS